MTYHKTIEKLRSGSILVLDGGTGTELEKRGVPMDPEAWCGIAALDNADILEKIHTDYLDAGADIITTNTYSSSRLMLALSGHEENFLEINKKTINAAQKARESSSKKDILIAGSLSHRGALVEGTALPHAQDSKSFGRMENALTELGFVLREEGCDFILLEMMYDPDKMKVAFSAAEKTGLPVWAGFSARQKKYGEPLSFLPSADIPLRELLEILSQFDVDAAGFMHTQSDAIQPSLQILKENFTAPLFAYPDSGYFKSPNWQFEDVISTHALKQFAKKWIEIGATVIGGCCGLTTEHIRALSALKSTD
ncbi:homocysteine S-methyltransferase family protein [Rhodospirillaceae bacterium]|nr:homocysteine S-methyltransferase family protein [Rhodospirillaceae bacterium]